MAQVKDGPTARERSQSLASAPRPWWPIGGGIVVVVAALVGYVTFRSASELPGVEMPDQGNVHIQLETDAHEPYNSDPPTSGPHMPYVPRGESTPSRSRRSSRSTTSRTGASPSSTTAHRAVRSWWTSSRPS